MPLYTHDRCVVGPTAFFGRQLLLRNVGKGLELGRSFALIGGPKTGRTSVLAMLIAALNERRVRQPKALRLTPVWVDVASLPSLASATWVPELWKRVEAALTDPYVLGANPVPRLPKNAFDGKKDPWQAFRELAAEFWHQTTGRSSWSRYVFIIDNVDELVLRRQYKALHELGKLLADTGPEAPMGAVFAGGRFLCEYIGGEDVPMHALRPVFLSSLTDADAEAMIHLGFPEMTPQDRASIKAGTGCHPYLLCRLLAELERLGSSVELDSALQAVRGDAQNVFNRTWQELDLNRQVAVRGMYAAPEHALMQFLIADGGQVAIRRAQKELGIKPLKELGEMLHYEGIVEQSLTHDQPVLSAGCGLWNSWYTDRVNR